MDSLNISSLKVAARIGVHAWEQKIDQTLLISLSIPMDCSQCNDQLENTLDYHALCEAVSEFVASKSFQLIETVANEVALLVKKRFKVEKVSITVAKPHAVKNVGNIEVSVTR